MSWFSTNLLAAFLLPPLNLLLLGTAGLLLLRRNARLGKILIAIGFAGIYALSTPYLSTYLLEALETTPALNLRNPPPADAIVVLGGGTYFDAPEYDGDTVSQLELERLRYAARVQRATNKPLLVTGGNPAGGTPEGILMQETLTKDFDTPVRWVETRSNNTWENALYSYRLIGKTHRRIFLVTHAWHMPRAKGAFEQAGFMVVAAPTGFSRIRDIGIFDFVPQSKGLQNSYYALHEYIGLVWYMIREL
jgi:uncharacterized SAM-binding protein YcdF (DUF218 family)